MWQCNFGLSGFHKKPGKAGKSEKRDDKPAGLIDTDTVLFGAISRGVDYSALKEMTVGQIVDYCITYNNLSDYSDDGTGTSPQQTNRKATQADWDNFFGR